MKHRLNTTPTYANSRSSFPSSWRADCLRMGMTIVILWNKPVWRRGKIFYCGSRGRDSTTGEGEPPICKACRRMQMGVRILAISQMIFFFFFFTFSGNRLRCIIWDLCSTEWTYPSFCILILWKGSLSVYMHSHYKAACIFSYLTTFLNRHKEILNAKTQPDKPRLMPILSTME